MSNDNINLRSDNMKKKIVKITANIVFYLVAIFLASYFVVNLIIPDKTVSIFGFKTYIIISPSMAPTFNVGDAVMVTKVDPEDLNPDDIISFKVYLKDLGDEAVVTHYLGETQTIGDEVIYKTHGEGDIVYDKWVDENDNPIEITEDMIIGRVAFNIPKGGNFFLMFQDPVMLLLIALNIGVIVFIVAYYKKNRKKPDKTD
jgi:signal peptidase